MSERKAFDAWLESWLPENPNANNAEDGWYIKSVMEDAWEAGRFALNSELGIASNEAAKAERLETFMHHIVTQDMVPLPVERIREWAKELLG